MARKRLSSGPAGGIATDKKTNRGLKIVGFMAILITLALIFTFDDVTGIGEVLDPLEFITTGLVGFGYPIITGLVNAKKASS